MKAWMLALLATGLLFVATPSPGEQFPAEPHQGGRVGAQGPGSAEDEEAIRQIIAAVFAAANRHDAKAGTLVFTDDADFVNVLGMWWKGPAEIERAWKSRFETGLKRATFKLLDARIRFLKPDVAIAHVTSQITGFQRPDGQVMAPHNELSLRVLTKHDGKWRVRAFHNTTVASSLSAPPER